MTARPLSLLDRAPVGGGALLLGCGGGGDIVQTIPVMNYLKRLGVERFAAGDVAVKWWESDGKISFGCEVIPLGWLQPSERLHDGAVRCVPETKLTTGLGAGRRPHEAVIAAELGCTTLSFSVERGAVGLLEACRSVMAQLDLSLFVVADIGSDSFFTGVETTVSSPLVDALTIAAAVALDGVFALSGYGCDAEMSLRSLQASIARVMKAGGYLGAHGLTPKDVEDLDAVLRHFPDETVEPWPLWAARGNLGEQTIKGMWPIEVTPLAAVTLFFDPNAVAGVNPLASLLSGTQSLTEAENLVLENSPLVPETRRPLEVDALIAPQSSRSSA